MRLHTTRVISLGVPSRTPYRRTHMVRIRSGLLVALVGVLALGACKKSDDKTGAPATADKTSEKTGGDKMTPPAPAAGGAISGQMGDDLALLPVDSEVVVGLNF